MTLQDMCEQRAKECYLLTEARLGTCIKRIPITFSNRMTKCAGKYIFKPHSPMEIRLSNKLLELNGEDFVLRTVGHEVAHHVAHVIYGRHIQPHGKEWRHVMSIIGQEAERCHSYKVPTSDGFKYVVAGEEYFLGKIQHGRCQRGQTYINKKTKAKITAGAWIND